MTDIFNIDIICTYSLYVRSNKLFTLHLDDTWAMFNEIMEQEEA